MTGRRTRPTTLVAALLVAGCAQQTAPAPPKLATKPTVGQEIGAVARNKVEISFANGSASLSPDATQQLDLAARLFRDIHPALMYSIGHSDAVGDEFSNVLLSAERARTVKQALVARGIPADRLYIQAFGESDPISRSDPNAPENRRVVVQWHVL